MGALDGLKVIELAHIMSGPTAGMLLADMGADVIKVEKIPGGDDTRRFIPPEVNGEASAFMMMNRNKRGIALDLKQDAARSVLRRLIDRADVVIENFRVGTLEKLNLGYDVLRLGNPALIYCAISGYGRTGPDAQKGGFDLVAQGLSGASPASLVARRPKSARPSPTSMREYSPPWRSSARTCTACAPARDKWSTHRCWRRVSCKRSGKVQSFLAAA